MVNKKYLFVLYLIILSIMLFSCDPPVYVYRDVHSALYTAANHSLFGMQTDEMDTVFVLEKDEYGRTLYMVKSSSWMQVYECNTDVNTYLVALLISQTDDDKTVSYYEYDNFICCYTERIDVSEETVLNFFTEEEIYQLKEKNDWGKELDLTKAVTKNISTSDFDVYYVHDEIIQDVIVELYGDDDNTFIDPMTQYSNGKTVYLMGRPLYQNIDDYSNEFYIVIFELAEGKESPDYTYEMVEDITKCHEQLNQLVG